MPHFLSLAAVLLLTGITTAQPKKPLDVPTSADPRLVVELFAASPDIVQPIAMDFDSKGRLLVIESHTHFRPAKYDGPKFDRIRMFEDTKGTGKADRITTFYEGTTFTMDLAIHPDGSVYLATRNEIIRLRDTKGTGTADEKTRIAFLDTKGNYPHNGLSGLSFDSQGNLNFGIGENLGADYKLIGADGTTLTGGGEGGNVYHITADGKKLRRVATGFWNPFGSCRDIFGHLFVVDNDPDASPPCRLVHVVEGGDYGFQFRYGRQGRHPFQAWNGELPGTLPYVCGTGESPTEVISYESDGLPKEYLGNLLVPAWADHRLERYELKPRGASFSGERKPFIQGGKDFFPSGLSVAPDGSLFVSDWGSQSYELHGKGAIWHVRWKDAKAEKREADQKKAILSADRKTREAAARELVKTEEGRAFLNRQLGDTDLRAAVTAFTALIGAKDEKIKLSDCLVELAVRGHVADAEDTSKLLRQLWEWARAAGLADIEGDTSQKALILHLVDTDPFLRHAVIRRLSQLPDVLAEIDPKSVKNSTQRIGLLLSWRASAHPDRLKTLAEFLKDLDPEVRFMAVKWVSDEKLKQFRPQIVEMLKSPSLDPRGVVGCTTALARIDDKPVNDDALSSVFLERLADKEAPASSRLAALRSIPANFAKLKTEQLTDLLKEADPAFRIEALRALKDRADGKAATAVLAIAKDAKQPVAVRAQSLVTFAAIAPPDIDFLTELIGGTEAALRHEAFRSLMQAKLTEPQREKLVAAAKGKDDSADVLARALGQPFQANRPAAKETEVWLKRLEGPADPGAGRRIFENVKLTGCSKCHRVEGRGANIGPDLSLIGRTERRWIVESILQPSAVVAPNFQTWKIQTTDDRTLTGLLIGTYLDVSEYIDEKGNRFKVLATEVADVRPIRTSIMPDGLLDGLTDQEIRDLIAYLAARK